MKLYFTWKDPDYDDEGALTKANLSIEREDQIQRQLDNLGIGEYITVEVDTEANTAVVVGKRKKT